jgi:prepilin-type N-terminal cleavage/methylation domain-containing protein
MKKFNQRGVTLVELMIAVAILGAMSSAVIIARTFMAKQTVITNQRAFATQKAIQMFEELKALVGGEETPISTLDGYSDGTLYNSVLTTDTNVDTAPPGSGNAATPASGNIKVNGAWRYVRQVQVIRLANDPYAREVIVSVWLNAGGPTTLLPQSVPGSNPLVPVQPLAQIAGILRSIQSLTPPTQVMDLYLLDIENTEGWWAPVPSMVSTYKTVIQNIESSTNNSLIIRPHFITRSSYGRDAYYTPYINYASGTDQTATNWAYLYPGLAPEDSSAGEAFFFYQPPNPSSPSQNTIIDTGRFNVDGTTILPSAPLASQGLTYAYSAADQFNNAVRYPDELATYNSVVSQVAAAGISTLSNPLTEISERMLIEGMLSSPASFTNAMIVNLHGEMLPLPPMRDYSDAAKDPANIVFGGISTSQGGAAVSWNTLNARVVTHPELLYYPGASAGSVTMNLRVYAYYDGMDDIYGKLDSLPSAGGHASTISGSVTYDPKLPAMSVYIPNYYVPSSNPASKMAITAITGMGVTNGTGSPMTLNAITWSGNVGSPSIADNYGGGAPVSVVVTNPTANTDTLITLYNTRLRCNQGPGASTGMPVSQRIYGLEYLPSSPEVTAAVTNASNFTFTAQNLTNTTANTPKNTARWIITLNSVPCTFTQSGGPMTVETLIGQGVTTNVAPSSGTNSYSTIQTSAGVTIPGLSSAITVKDIPSNMSRTYAWIGNNCPPPTTEQYQFIGDPRHCPYLDVKAGGPSITGAGATIMGNGYNWYFVNLSSAAGYAGYGDTSSTTGWGDYGGDNGSTDYVNIENDVPRFYQMIRQGIENTTSIFGTISGYMNYYYGLGGEFGYDQSPYSNGVSYLQGPWNNGNASVQGTDEILTQSWGVSTSSHHLTSYSRIIANLSNGSVGQDAWYARPWMGELYPDSQYVTFWSKYGNLPTASNPVVNLISNLDFFREDFANIPNSTSTYSYNTGFRGSTYHYGKSTSTEGSSAFFNGYSAGTTIPFTVDAPSSGTGNLYSLGVTCYNIFGYPLATVNNMNRSWSLTQPFSATGGAWNMPTNWGVTGMNGYSSPDTLTIPAITGQSGSPVTELFYNSNDSNSNFTTCGTGVVQMKSPAGKVGYSMINGMSTSSSVGNSALGTASLIFLMRTFLDMGLQNGAAHITQVPLIKIYVDSPTYQYFSPSTIGVTISSPVTTSTGPVTNVWWRFPGLSVNPANFYDEEYWGYNNLLSAAATYSEPVSLHVEIKYSKDTGNTWQYLNTNDAAVTGVPSTVTGDYTLTNTMPVVASWNVPAASFPQGQYVILAEAYRNGYPLHYAFHQVNITIDR